MPCPDGCAFPARRAPGGADARLLPTASAILHETGREIHRSRHVRDGIRTVQPFGAAVPAGSSPSTASRISSAVTSPALAKTTRPSGARTTV